MENQALQETRDMRAVGKATKEGEGSRVAGLYGYPLHIPGEKVPDGPHLWMRKQWRLRR